MGGWGEVIGGPRVWARDLSVAVFIGLTLAFIGPFGSYDRPLEARLLTCLGYGLAGSAVFWPSVRLGLRLGARAGLPDAFAAVMALAAASAPVALVVWLISPLVNPGRHSTGAMTLYFSVLALALPLGFAVLFVARWAEPRPMVDATPDPVRPRLLARLPGRLGQEVIALQAEDHYVRVHTVLGSDLLLMRFADAVAEAEGIDGLRVHRSWWVAKAAVVSAKAEGRRAVLTLTTGLEVPVTRESVPEVRRAGWL
jgi:hypothetical protein